MNLKIQGVMWTYRHMLAISFNNVFYIVLDEWEWAGCVTITKLLHWLWVMNNIKLTIPLGCKPKVKEREHINLENKQ